MLVKRQTVTFTFSFKPISYTADIYFLLRKAFKIGPV